MNASVVYAIALLAVQSCSASSSAEEPFVGVWQSAVHQDDGSDTPIEFTFKADGTVTWEFPDKPPAWSGRWRVDGQDIIVTVERQPTDYGLPDLPPQLRYHVVKVTERELALSTERAGQSHWKRIH
jgi:hypothetical protein